MMQRKCFSFFILLIFSVSSAYAQVDDDFSSVLKVPLFFSEVNPESPAGIFALDLPFYFPGDNIEKEQFSFGYSMGNTWHPQASFVYPQNITTEQKTQLDGISNVFAPEIF